MNKISYEFLVFNFVLFQARPFFFLFWGSVLDEELSYLSFCGDIEINFRIVIKFFHE